MKIYRQITLTLLLVILAFPTLALGQSATAEAQRLAGVLGQSNEFPVNVRLRYQVLQDLLPNLKGKTDPKPVLTFFSTTRILSWNRPVPAETASTLRSFESQMVSLAKEKGISLDLPPVGYSGAGAPSALPQAAGGAVLPGRSDSDTLAKATLRAEEFATDGLNRGSSPQLLALRDSLTALRLDLADPSVSSDAVREVLRTRVEFLASPTSRSADAGLLEHLDKLTDLLRGTFSPEMLRVTRGQQIQL